jgi:predicted transcriptional regulator
MLTEFFGNYPRIRVIDLLLSHPYTEYTKIDIAECSDVARGTLYGFFEELTKYKLIKPTRKIGNTQLYSIDMDSQVVKALSAFQILLASKVIENELEGSHGKVADINGLFKDIDNIFEDEMSTRSNSTDHKL